MNDFNNNSLDKTLDEKIKKTAELIKDSKSIVALTGAGMSTESGIPDFRSPGTGIWEKIDPMKFASIDSFIKGLDLDELINLISDLDITSIFTSEPNEGHKALAELETINKLEGIITQNVDMLHQKAGCKNVIEIHGSMKTASCLRCNKKIEFDEFLAETIEQQKIPPKCPCGGIIKPDVVFFGEMLPKKALSRSIEYVSRCDMLLAIGSSLVVYPVSSLPRLAKEHGAKLVIINIEKTPYDNVADVVIHGKIGTVLPRVVKEVKRLMK
ncbi:MAG: NAD-dependent deacylase [Candidatus Methanoliparum thermophilum]|uniref:NAD-dependent deacylase n=1 Tax=Methanoliparum thermophilum TaxID=2491083 RepID=A0A520KTR3_METT2|nr:NAD-dependent deacylase [Candidatus Methanoliparum sp. LAM-1]RZN65206.1 MAG: NAD-dependent deacylase [Candidatus Methanoliparum thermophilum]BDC36610.1 NAD-dependent deacetylase [Candidatus Methanoliparum sp. LAM-1]